VPHAESVAERIVSELGITAPRELVIEDIAWVRGALVCYERLERAAARLVVRGSKSVITVSTELSSVGQRRFAVGHELGHLELHRTRNDVNLCLSSDLEEGLGEHSPTAEPEQEASEFASALLMPSALFRPRCERQTPSIALVSQLATDFETSLTATAIRYMNVCAEECAVVWSQSRRIRWYRGTHDFGYHVKVHDELDPYSIAVDFFDGKTLPRRGTTVDASCWLAPGRYRDDAMIVEDSIAIPSLDAVLTLLWIDKDIEREFVREESFTPDGRWRRR